MPRKKLQETTGKLEAPEASSKKTTKQNLGFVQVHGKIETGHQPVTLEQVWGDTGISEYGTMDAEQYKSNLGEMNKADLNAHASQKGIIPCDDRNLLERKLVSEFSRHVATYKRPTQQTNSPRIGKDVLKILSEGR